VTPDADIVASVGVAIRRLTTDEIDRTTEIPRSAIGRYMEAGMSEEEALREAAEFDSGGLHVAMEQYALLSDGRRIQTEAATEGFEVHTLEGLEGEADDDRICAAMRRTMRLDIPEDRWLRLTLALERNGIELSGAYLDSLPMTIEVDHEAAEPLPEGM
jgi:hypothetical protein